MIRARSPHALSLKTNFARPAQAFAGPCVVAPRHASMTPAQLLKGFLQVRLSLPIENPESIFQEANALARTHEWPDIPQAAKAQIFAESWSALLPTVESRRKDAILGAVRNVKSLDAEGEGSPVRSSALDQARRNLVTVLHTHDFAFLVTVLQATFWSCMTQLLSLDENTRVSVLETMRKRQSVAVHTGATVFYHQVEKKAVDRLAQYPVLIRDMVDQFTQARSGGDFPAGPAYNRVQKNLVDSVFAVLQHTNEQLKNAGKAPLPVHDFFTTGIGPYRYPMAPPPSPLVKLMRQLKGARVIHQGIVQMRAMRLFRGSRAPLFTEFSALTGTAAEGKNGTLLDFIFGRKPRTPMFEFWYRRYIDRQAEKMARFFNAASELDFQSALKKPHEARKLWAHLCLAEKEFYRQMRTSAGILPNRAFGQTVDLAYGPGAKSAAEQMSRRFTESPRVAIFASHKATTDEFILFEALATSELNRTFNGALGDSAIFARSDWDKNIWPFNVTDWAKDQADLYNVLMIDEDPIGPLVAIGQGVADGTLSWRHRSTILFPEGGRSFFFHNPPLAAGLGILANNAEVILPLGIRNSSGEKLHGGKASVVAGRVTTPQTWGLGDTLIKTPKDAVRLIRKNAEKLGPLVDFVSTEIFLNTYNFD